MPVCRFSLGRTMSAALVVAGCGIGQDCRAADPVSIEVTIKDHHFSPSEIHVQTGKPTVLKIRNEDSTAEEFDSSALQIEKIVAAGATATVRLHPLGPGRFPFMGEFHADTAQGVVVSE